MDKNSFTLNSINSFQHNYHVFDHSPRDGFNFIFPSGGLSKILLLRP